MPDISPTAIVESAARLADDVRVGPFAYIGPEVQLGPGCTIDGGATVTGRTTLGVKCHVFPMAVVGALPDDADARGECIIGEANAIREHVTVCGGIAAPTRMGNDNLVMIGSYMGPGARIGNHCILTNYTFVDGGAQMEDYVGTSAFTTILPGVRIGAYSYLTGYAVIDRDSPPFAMVQGFPCRVRGVNSEKLRRCGFGDEDIRLIRNAFRDIFNGENGLAEPSVVGKLLAEKPDNPHVRQLLEALGKAVGRSPGRD